MFTPLLLATLGGAALAESPEQALYAPAPPNGSAFVRVVNTGGAAPLQVAGRPIGPLEAGTTSAYLVAMAGEREVKLGTASVKFTAEAGYFYTLAPRDGQLVLQADPVNRNLAKANITLYNFTELPSLSLRTADGATVLVDAVAPFAQGSRAVNAISVDLAVFADGAALHALPGLKLESGNAYSAVVIGKAGATPTVTWVTAQTDTLR